jgi:hypothetical protein
MAGWIRRAGLPFLERFASLEELGRVLEEDDALARLICPIPHERARVRAIVRDLLAR